MVDVGMSVSITKWWEGVSMGFLLPSVLFLFIFFFFNLGTPILANSCSSLYIQFLCKHLMIERVTEASLIKFIMLKDQRSCSVLLSKEDTCNSVVCAILPCCTNVHPVITS